MGNLKEQSKFGLRAGSNYSDDFKFLPSAAALYQFETDKFFMQLSVSYTETEPTLHQMYLPYQQVDIYGSLGKEYSEQGNLNLKKEKQLIGSLILEPGTVDDKLTFSFTGGKIFDAIEWRDWDTFIGPGAVFFSPINYNLTFFSTSITSNFELSDFLKFNAGSALNYLNYGFSRNRAYSPEYNIFSGLELHYFWKSRLIDLYAYGEIRYVGPYDGYDKTGLGEELIANSKLSIGLKNFRFHIVFQNNFDNQIEVRENLKLPGRFFYYGLVWKFYD
jgi:hypothetical protein